MQNAENTQKTHEIPTHELPRMRAWMLISIDRNKGGARTGYTHMMQPSHMNPMHWDAPPGVSQKTAVSARAFASARVQLYSHHARLGRRFRVGHAFVRTI